MNSPRVTLRLPAPLLSQLRQVADATGMDLSTIIRTLVEVMLTPRATSPTRPSTTAPAHNCAQAILAQCDPSTKQALRQVAGDLGTRDPQLVLSAALTQWLQQQRAWRWRQAPR